MSSDFTRSDASGELCESATSTANEPKLLLGGGQARISNEPKLLVLGGQTKKARVPKAPIWGYPSVTPGQQLAHGVCVWRTIEAELEKERWIHLQTVHSVCTHGYRSDVTVVPHIDLPSQGTAAILDTFSELVKDQKLGYDSKRTYRKGGLKGGSRSSSADLVEVGLVNHRCRHTVRGGAWHYVSQVCFMCGAA